MEQRNDLLRGAWAAFDFASRASMPVVVQPSVPIAWFGDLEAFQASALRVVTVGLNPSRLEFPADDPFSRFPIAGSLRGAPNTDAELETYASSLNAYFRTEPYDAWFRPAFEPLLQGLEASYYGACSSTAVHTDLCSPIATDPPWSQLRRERDMLRSAGVPLWHNLIRFLKPHVIVASVARLNLSEIEFPLVGAWRPAHTIERGRPYLVEVVGLDIGAEQPALLVFGQAAQLPFGTVSARGKNEIGQALREVLDAS